MLSNCLKCRKKPEIKTQGLQRQKKEYFYQKMQRMIGKNRDLLKRKKLVGY